MRKGEGEVGRIKVWKGTEMVDRSGVRIMLRLPRKARFRIIMVAHGGDCEVFAASHVAHSRVRAGIASILPTIIIAHRSTCVQTLLLLLARMLACDHLQCWPKPAFAGGNFSSSFMLAIDRAYHLAAVKGKMAQASNLCSAGAPF